VTMIMVEPPITPWRRMSIATRRFTTIFSLLANVSIILLFISSSTALAAVSDVQVVVYSGPNECSNDDGGKLNKIIPDSIVGLHFTVTIDPTSIGSKSLLGKVIESSKSSSGMGGIAPSFPVGQGKVISGLDVGLLGLCRGSSAYIIVPPHLGYGKLGKPNVGVEPDTTLRYDVEILDIQPPILNDFRKIDTNHDWLISVEEARMYFDALGQAINLDGLWKEEDIDHDGYISWMEFTGPKGTEGPPPPRDSSTTQKEDRRWRRRQEEKQEERHVNQHTTQTTTIASEKGNGDNNIATLLQSIDTDNDGKISKIELAAIFRSLGQEMMEEFWRESDPDGDGYVSYEEFVGSGGSNSGATPTTTSDTMAERGGEMEL
jgi:Ca2+-binding EF-hand superfamily protein